MPLSSKGTSICKWKSVIRSMFSMSSDKSNNTLKSKMARERPPKFGQMVVTFPLVDRPKVTRSRGPKVRSGCDSCKKRHLKCDETKPSCHRCLKWRGYCEGYGHGTDHEIQLLVEPDSNTKVFKHDWEKKYFDNWNALAAKLGGEWFQMGLFSRTVPQLSHQEPSVRYGVIAVGAMVNAKSSGGGFPDKMGTSNPHYSAAINYYSRALRLLQSKSDQTSTETAIQRTLLACLLFACFETLDGSYGTAANHVNHGLKILESFRKNNQPLRSGCLEKAPTLEDEVLQILQRLDYQSWTVGLLDRWRQSSPRVYSSTAPSHRLDETHIPKQFTSLDQARRWWDLVLYRSLHSRPTVSGISTPTDDQDDHSQGSCFSASPSSLSDDSPNDDDNNNRPDEDPDKIFEIQPPPSDKLTMLENWHHAFLPLYITARNNQKSDTTPYLQSVSLLQQHHIAWICLRTGYFTDYMTLYSLTPRFREIVRLGGILLSHTLAPSPPSPSHEKTQKMSATVGERETPFTLDNGPTLPLFLTSMKCRDRHVRAQALDLLKKYPRRDAFWSSHAAAAIAKLNVQFEEANEDGGSPLEEQFARLRMREGVFVDRKRELRGRFFFKDPEGWVKKAVVVKW